MSGGKCWLHFVCRAYYPTPASFAREAERYGVTRRVSLQVLKQMAWGDTVLLAMKEGEGSVVFGEFVVEKLSGLSEQARRRVAEGFALEQVNAGGQAVARGCGEYVTGPTYRVDATLRQIAELLARVEDPGRLMVGGPFTRRETVRTAVPFRQGFRRFDGEAFQAAVEAARGECHGKLKVKGQFYVREAGPAGEPEGGLVQEVRDYRRKEEL